MKKRLWILLAIPFIILLAAFILRIPAVAWRVDDLKTRLVYFFNPPDQAVFVPAGETPRATPTRPEATPTPEDHAFTPTPEEAQETAGPTPTPLPELVVLDGIVYVDQHERWNYCGPANLAMALNYWGWPGDRDDIARVVKPGIPDPDLTFIQQGRLDKNVMPSEMIGFVAGHTDFNIVARYGGTLDLLKSLIASGYPVVVEKGYYEEDYTGKIAWLGHYLFTTGYDEAAGEFVVQDAYLKPGKNMRVDYKTYIEGWRSFNYLFMVVYPPADQERVLEILGPWADPAYGYQQGLEIALEESETLSGVDQFFAWFNQGTSLVKLERYTEAGQAFDRAYQIYSSLEADDTVRPYRITWYQTTPYMAYYFSGRYQDVLNLAEFTLDTIAEPTLEETLYWRGLAHYALGNRAQAQTDLYQAVWLNPNFDAALIQLGSLDFD